MFEKLKNVNWSTVGVYAKWIIVVGFILSLAAVQFEHSKQVESLKSEINKLNGKVDEKPAPTVKIINPDRNVDAAIISSAGQISANQSSEFTNMVQTKENSITQGKSKNLYEFDYNLNTKDTISSLKKDIAEKNMPKEVNKADFVTIQEDKKDVSKSPDGTQKTKVKVNAYYNYQPSVYVLKEISPEFNMNRWDLIYTNRDLALGVNFDAKRKGDIKSKFGVDVGCRVIKW